MLGASDGGTHGQGHGRTGKTQAGRTGGLRQASSWGATDPTLTRPPSTTFATASTSPCTTYSGVSSSSPPLPSLCSSLPHVTLRSDGSENTKEIIGLIQAGSTEPTSGLKNRLPLLITSDHSGVAGRCRGLQISHSQAGCSAQGCWVLHRIAFRVVSEWCQEAVDYASPVVL